MRRHHTPRLFVAMVAALMLMSFGASVSAHPVRGKKVSRAATHQKAVKAAEAKALAMKITKLKRQIGPLRRATWSWQRVSQTTPTRAASKAGQCEKSRGLAYLKWCFNLWKKRHQTAQHYAMNPPHKSQWLCIHGYEGSWTDPNSPYYGGLQMDLEFQDTYGHDLLRAKGTADHWTPLEQMWVAERAYRTRGFYPWPNTARYCGLL